MNLGFVNAEKVDTKKTIKKRYLTSTYVRNFSKGLVLEEEITYPLKDPMPSGMAYAGMASKAPGQHPMQGLPTVLTTDDHKETYVGKVNGFNETEFLDKYVHFWRDDRDRFVRAMNGLCTK